MSYSDYHSFRFKLNRTMIVQRRYNKVYSEQFPGPTLYMGQRETQLLSEPQAIENTRNKDIELLTRIPIESIISEIGQVLVMTPQILLNALRHSFVKLETIKIILFDECHHARGRHPYACIMTEFFHRQVEPNNLQLPRILGMTASPINTKERSNGFVELPPELCSIFMSPVSVSTCYSFSFAFAIMHRIESLLIASSLKKTYADCCKQNFIATTKILTVKVSLIPSHCPRNRKLPGFMRNEPLDHKMWIVPGDQIENFRGFQLSTATKVDFLNVPCTRSLPANPAELLNIKYLESILMYSFSDASLLVEALTHGSLCYRRFPSVISVLSFLEILYWIIS
ncbi:hypothetical protein POM88_045162 [Heracleum sosnowskyi]|uniref:Helicase ATP-binding domain-containing protein n=1 Tax=Heracleum sosnowskyi TaxID=360622 RepID=A0AAD8H6K8_9APIA|nr:hypothetical protein POM88_045162 [Heracleum sosnowskyi]